MSHVWLVTAGGYEMGPLAAFDDKTAAQNWADRWNLANLGRVSDDSKAVVSSMMIPFNPEAVR